MKIKHYLFLLITTIFVLELNAQNNTSSPYSIRGFGEIEEFQSAYTRSLGGATNGIRSQRCLSFSNPASYGALTMMMLDFGFRGDYSKVYSETAAKTKYNGNFNYISIAFPMYRKPIVKKDTSVKTKETKLYREYKTIWAGGFGLSPYSNISASFTKDIDTSYGQIINSYSRTGGLTRVYFTNAVNLSNNLSLGLNTSYIFGQSRSLDGYFLSDSFVSRATIQENNIRYNGFKFEFGVQAQRNKDTIIVTDSIVENNVKVLRVRRMPLRFVFGATVNNNAQLDYSIYRKITNKSSFNPYAAVDTVLLQENKTGKTNMPFGYSAGLSLTYNNTWMLAVDYKTDQWGTMKNSLFTDTFSNSSQWNFGLAFRPDANVEMFRTKDKNKFSANLEYRLGFRMLNTGYLFKDNKGQINPLKEYGISFGIGIPKTRLEYDSKRMIIKSMVNITGEYIHRGNTNNGMIAENLYRLTIGFTLADIWFKQRKFY